MGSRRIRIRQVKRMERMFVNHKIRQITELNDVWQFSAPCCEAPIPVLVPGCLETYPGFENYRGPFRYEKTIHAGGSFRLVFKGVSHTADIWLDNVKIARHYNAYTPFSVLVPESEEGEHLLCVAGTNAFCEESSLHIPNDYYTYGGITRPVYLEKINRAFIRFVHFFPEKRDNVWTARIKCCIHALENLPQLSVSFCLGSDLFFSKTVDLQAGESVIETNAVFPDVSEYGPDHPVLYDLSARLSLGGEWIDDLIDRVGFREITVCGQDILWNGQKINLRGFNRHEDHGLFGCAIPPEAMDLDLRLLRDMGANAVRTCHYPNDERFLDLCDTYGILVWEESHARGLSEEQMRHPLFRQQSMDCIDEMMENHLNHPAIFVWGMLNECASDTAYGRTIYQEQADRIRAWDTSRPVTFASCKMMHDLCLDIPDIVSMNLYPLWYLDTDPAEYLQKVYEWIQTTPGKGKPFLVSEIGAGAIPGFFSPASPKWSENRQADILEKQLQAVLSFPACNGVLIWQFADGRVPDSEFFSRPRSMNNKGVLDEYRRPKLSFQTVKKLFGR